MNSCHAHSAGALKQTYARMAESGTGEATVSLAQFQSGTTALTCLGNPTVELSVLGVICHLLLLPGTFGFRNFFKRGT